MKTIKYLVYASVIMCFISCKNDKATGTAEKNVFTITLNATVKKDDSFQIFYKEDDNTSNPYEENYSVFSEFKGSDKPQDIVFHLPEGVLPTQLRFDFGNNKQQSDIIVNTFKIAYKDKVFEANGGDFFNFFRPEEAFVKIDKATATATPFTTKDGSYDPMFFSEASLNAALVKLSR